MIDNDYIGSVKFQFNQYKKLAEKAMEQVPDEKINWQFNPETNSIATIVKHLSGNMLSRFTDFFTSDGEKEWRDRDGEFENELLTRAELLARWNKGWDCFSEVLNTLRPDDLSKTILIRNEKHTAMEAINRQLTHYAYHIGQIIFIAKMVCDNNWKSLTIPRGESKAFNTKMGL
jgi:hypothetical protein